MSARTTLEDGSRRPLSTTALDDPLSMTPLDEPSRRHPLDDPSLDDPFRRPLSTAPSRRPSLDDPGRVAGSQTRPKSSARVALRSGRCEHRRQVWGEQNRDEKQVQALRLPVHHPSVQSEETCSVSSLEGRAVHWHVAIADRTVAADQKSTRSHRPHLRPSATSLPSKRPCRTGAPSYLNKICIGIADSSK